MESDKIRDLWYDLDISSDLPFMDFIISGLTKSKRDLEELIDDVNIEIKKISKSKKKNSREMQIILNDVLRLCIELDECNMLIEFYRDGGKFNSYFLAND